MPDETEGFPPDQPAAAPTQQYQAQAAQAVGEVQAAPGTDAGESLEEMKAAAVRAAMSDFEKRLQDTLAAAEQQRSALQDQLASMQRQIATVRAQAGPPLAQLLAAAISQRLPAIAAANPDLGTQHFAGVTDQAGRLKEHVDGLASGEPGASVDEVHRLIGGVEQWLSRVHPRASGKNLEGADILTEELERLRDEAPGLQPAQG